MGLQRPQNLTILCLDISSMYIETGIPLHSKIVLWGSLTYTRKIPMKIGRDAKTGQFIPVKVAERRKATTIVETIKIGGRQKKNK
ncbi:MAG: hypothetical protein CMP20_00745 [Rickettsiales bacterium]|nr:hypothetical protein [Rickettsiales bacterium]